MPAAIWWCDAFCVRATGGGKSHDQDDIWRLTACRAKHPSTAPGGDVLGRVRHAGVPHELLEPPGIHAAVGLYCPGSTSQAVRMDRKVNMRIASCSRDHLIDGEPAESLAAFAGEDVTAPGLLLALEPFQALGFVRFHVMNAVDAALETPDLHGALAPVDVVRAQNGG
jgi:hypothetical protein